VLDALRSRAATVRIVLVSLALVAGMFVFVFPTRTWWAARQQVTSSEAQLALLKKQNARLEAQARHLDDDATIERLARAEFGYVMPGEQAFTAIPAPPTTTTTTTTAPPPTTTTTAAPATRHATTRHATTTTTTKAAKPRGH
jgi:cell division protein FtsB